MKFLVFVATTFLVMNLNVCGQDSTAMKQIADVSKQYEQQFIDALKHKDIDKCLSFFTANAVKAFGRDFLISELKELSASYQNYPKPEIRYSIGYPVDGIGTFGHDVDGTIELECFYCFRNKKGKTINYFKIYYTNMPPKGQIQTFTTKASIDKELAQWKHSK